ncbi:hypothetical protein EK599_14300 [Vibrio sp. T187]|uniref:hypothetical protein n=1 Tax=Vibrio TaxID=662 RepID=UPI0010CA1C5B|nr:MULTISPECIES: hypothetical protein [Vibrio]MBW3696867.1 hypothetical protein [Vibrio sp. T187]
MRYKSAPVSPEERQETARERSARQRQERRTELKYSETDEQRWAYYRECTVANRQLENNPATDDSQISELTNKPTANDSKNSELENNPATNDPKTSELKNKPTINYSKIRELQASKIKLECTRCAVRTMKYLVSGKTKYLSLPIFSKKEGRSTNEVIIDCNKDNFLSKHNKKVEIINSGYFSIKAFESKFSASSVGTIAFLFGGLRIEGERDLVGHTLIAYQTEEGIKYLDSTTPDHFDLAFNSPQIYFKDGFFSVSRQKQAVWVESGFEGMIVSDQV